jgi:diaminobutyrate-2-oxoglutarate transaminase
MDVFESLESNVRSYCRSWPVVFDRARGSRLYDEHGREYLDFFAGAGALNYGHNNPLLKAALLDYLRADRVVQALDMHTVAKREFLTTFDELVLRPRGLDYRVMFPGPTGASSVEAALKLARKATGRTSVISFTNAFHGMSLGALSVTGNVRKRVGAGLPLGGTTLMPYDHYLGTATDFALLERMLSDPGSGLDQPAAVIVETVQGEGGVIAARPEWLRGLADLCRRHRIPLIVDDVQMGCGRTGPFFSFEVAGIEPDIVCLAKSIGGYGSPMALTLFRPELDVWQPGEHSGTFRGYNPAFVTATEALRVYWTDDSLTRATLAKGDRVDAALRRLVASPGIAAEPRGVGLVRGLAFDSGEVAGKVCQAAFDRGLLMETAGPNGEVAKLMPPLTISDRELNDGLARFADAVHTIC